MHSREVMMRCIEVIGGSGIRETQRLLRDAQALHDHVMACPDDEPDTTKRKARGQAAE